MKGVFWGLGLLLLGILLVLGLSSGPDAAYGPLSTEELVATVGGYDAIQYADYYWWRDWSYTTTLCCDTSVHDCTTLADCDDPDAPPGRSPYGVQTELNAGWQRVAGSKTYGVWYAAYPDTEHVYCRCSQWGDCETYLTGSGDIVSSYQLITTS